MSSVVLGFFYPPVKLLLVRASLLDSSIFLKLVHVPTRTNIGRVCPKRRQLISFLGAAVSPFPNAVLTTLKFYLHLNFVEQRILCDEMKKRGEARGEKEEDGGGGEGKVSCKMK